MAQQHPHPTEIKYHQKSRQLEIGFDDGAHFEMSAEYLRVHSPSAEVQGHGPGEGVLQVDKEDVNIERIEPVGNYAVRLVFDDGHDELLVRWGVAKGWEVRIGVGGFAWFDDPGGDKSGLEAFGIGAKVQLAESVAVLGGVEVALIVGAEITRISAFR